MNQPVLVGVGEIAEGREAWVSSGGLVRLNPLDTCHALGMNVVQLSVWPGPFVTTLLENAGGDCLFPLVFAVDNRELVTEVRLSPRNELVDEVIERTPRVVEDITDDRSPSDRRLIELLKDHGDSVILGVEHERESVRLRVKEGTDFFVEGVQMFLSSVEFGSAGV